MNPPKYRGMGVSTTSWKLQHESDKQLNFCWPNSPYTLKLSPYARSPWSCCSMVSSNTLPSSFCFCTVASCAPAWEPSCALVNKWHLELLAYNLQLLLYIHSLQDKSFHSYILQGHGRTFKVSDFSGKKKKKITHRLFPPVNFFSFKNVPLNNWRWWQLMWWEA